MNSQHSVLGHTGMASIVIFVLILEVCKSLSSCAVRAAFWALIISGNNWQMSIARCLYNWDGAINTIILHLLLRV